MDWFGFTIGAFLGGLFVGFVSFLLAWRPLNTKWQQQQKNSEQALQQLAVAQREQLMMAAQKDELVSKIETVNSQRETLLQQNAKNEALLKEAADMKQQLNETFENLSQKVLKGRLEELEEKTSKHRHEDLKSVDAIIKPLQELIQRNDKDTQSLKTQLDGFVRLNSQWVEAIRGSKGRGDWGELELYRLLEESGVTFEKQISENGLRPDVKVPLTNGRFLYIDAKTILTNLSRIDDQSDTEGAAEERQKHVKALESEIKKLSVKSYETLVKGSIDFVVLFVPRESMLRVALEERPALMEYAFRQNVILASPLILMAVLKAVAYEWQQVRLSDDAETIKNIGQELHKRAETFVKKFDKVGSQMVTMQNSYVDAQRSLTSRFIPQLKKFETLGCASKNPVPEELTETDVTIPRLTADEEKITKAPSTPSSLESPSEVLV